MADKYIKCEDATAILEQKQRDICPAGRCGHGYVYGRDRDEYDAIEADIDAINNIPAADVRPAAEVDAAVDEALRILNALNGTGRLEYGDYCEIFDAIEAVKSTDKKGAENG